MSKITLKGGGSWEFDDNWYKEQELLRYLGNAIEMQEMQQKLTEAIRVFNNESFDARDRMMKFSLLKTVALIWRGNGFETGTEQGGTQNEIMITLEALLNTTEVSLECLENWDAEGSDADVNGWRMMGQQAAKAFFILNESLKSNTKLTVPIIKHVHKILMSGALTNNGEFRTHPAMADGYIFADHVDIDSRMETLVAAFENGLGRMDGISLAVTLMLDFVTIHPFSNGNGRMCRFLLSYGLQRAGFPFPVTLDSGHSKAYKHYINALKAAQGRGKRGPLLQLTLLSVHRTLMNFVSFSESRQLLDIYS